MNNNTISLLLAKPGKEYVINHIEHGETAACHLTGYGLFPGAKIKFLFASPSNDPCAYEVMGAVLALRNEDSKNIFII